MDDWQVGDLALCVNDIFSEPMRIGMSRPSAGAVYRIESMRHQAFANGRSGLGLVFKDGPLNRQTMNGVVTFEAIWSAHRFRRIAPLTPEEHLEAIRELANDTKTPATA